MRRLIYLLAVCLGIPIAMSAQGTAYIEYWFDSDHAHTVRVTATYGSTSFSPDVSGLSRGFHRISYRYQAGDGKWSAPHSAIFMCNNGSYTGAWKCEYWFDQNYAQRKTKKTEGRIFTLQEDVSQLSMGMHRFCYRIQDPQGRWSGVHTSVFLLYDGGSADNGITAYQYWYDEEDALAETVELSDPVSPYLLNVDFDVADLADEITPDNLAVVKDEFGYNQIGRATNLHIRFKDKSRTWSSVKTFPFVNLMENPLLNGFIQNPEADEGMDYWDGSYDVNGSDGETGEDVPLAPAVGNAPPQRSEAEDRLFLLSEGGWMSQTIEGLPYTGLRLTFWAAVDHGGEMSLKVGDQEINITSSTWQNYHVDFLPGEDGVFTIECEALKLNGRIDHFALTLPVDEVQMDEADFALLKRFYEESGGDGWTHKWNFASTPAATGRLDGVKTRNGRVVRVSLPDNNLKGTLGSTLFSLPELAEINLRGNQLCGNMDTWMATLRQSGIKCTHLRHLDLSGNQFTGNLGAVGDAFPELVSLRAAECHLTDVMPALPAHISRLDIGGQTFDRGFTFSELTAGSLLKETVPTILLYDHATRDYRSTLPLTLLGSDEAGTWRARLDVYDGGSRITRLNDSEAVSYLPVGAMLQATYRDFVIPVQFDFLMGDVDFSGHVSVGDLQKTINLALEREVPLYNYTAANIVADEVINVQDVAALVTTMTTEPATMLRMPRYDFLLDDETEAKAQVYVADGCLMLDSELPVAAFDLTLTGGTDEWEWLQDETGMQCTVKNNGGATRVIGYSVFGHELPAGQTVLARTGRTGVDRVEAVDVEGTVVKTAINAVPTGIMTASKGVTLMVNDGTLRLWTDSILHDVDWQVSTLSGQIMVQGHADRLTAGSTTLCHMNGQPVVVKVVAGNMVMTQKLSIK